MSTNGQTDKPNYACAPRDDVRAHKTVTAVSHTHSTCAHPTKSNSKTSVYVGRWQEPRVHTNTHTSPPGAVAVLL